MHALIDRLIRPEIRALRAYHVPPAAGLIKLDAMENPYAWPEALREDWLEALRDAAMHRYPDPRGGALQPALREAMGIPADMGLLLGNGSDELIQMLALAVAAPRAGERPKVLSVEPSFVMYRMIALFAGLDHVGVPLQPQDFSLDAERLLTTIEQEQPALVFLAYPNNPTGNLFDPDLIERVIEASPGLVIVDEAYAPFTDASFIPRLGHWPNLLVMRTVSKMGLAGLRLGYLAGPPAWLEQFDKVRLPYNINVLTQASAAFALRRRDVLDQQTQAIRSQRAALLASMGSIAGIHCYPSDANFILFRTAPGQAGAVFDGLLHRGVLIKNLDGAHPMLSDCLRVTVGTPDENAAFLEALSESLSSTQR
ncbi:histidinol-phosphate transaminase [Thiohalocapsa marina]|uniref:Histidinol-phosphate aminotransferase n=1 Tax=Thiohalocapsa marina TaxID=424902 RepID=A0A5M8FRF7_9GAMM|nr:histidinol-phosphate transaminase [Thiohalocapsa marina]KAA6186051.1 histidinol-phosphate transaminase [Thiohalocapsa marina]